jgi:hypothetical protein
MRFRLEQRFPGPLATVEAALVDPAFIDRLGTLSQLGRPRLLRREDDGALVRLDVRYAFTGELSGAVTAVVDPERLTWVDVAVFDRATHRSRHRILPDHYADRLSCTYETALHQEGDTVRVAEGELRVRFPLVGGRVERAIVSGMAEHAHHEEAALADWLAEQPEQG